ncbi:MAG: SPFH domain-containing protein [Chloroflexota bacterium]
MFGIQYLKASPTQHVLLYHNGKLKRSGTGLSFYYYKPLASIAVVPVSSADVPFIFNEMSADFQPVTLQGLLTYRITQPELVASILDYAIDGSPERYRSEDPEKLPQRLVNLTQTLARAELQNRPLRQAIHASQEVAEAVFAGLVSHPALDALGVEVLSLIIQAIRPTPEMARALEAEAREFLLRQADDAIYTRRNAAIEQERRIKENELNTEVAVEEKKRQIREAKANADLAVEAKEQQLREIRLTGQVRLEEERKRLVEERAANARVEADAQAYALEASLRPLAELDNNVLQMLAVHSAEPRLMVATALKEIAQNAAKIGNLNISPELLETLLADR